MLSSFVVKSIKEIRRDNLKLLIAETGDRTSFTDKPKAVELDVSYGYVGLLINGHSNIGDKVAEKLEEIGGKPRYWLDTAHGTISDDASEYVTRPKSNIADGPTSKGMVPLISWVQAGDFCEAIDLFEAGDAEKWLPCPVNHSEQTYILRVQGSSMEPEYRDGDLIFVDPHVQAIHNSDIIVRLEDANTATFKRLQIVSGEHYVSPINKDWPEPVIRITESAQICGVVIFSGRLR